MSLSSSLLLQLFIGNVFPYSARGDVENAEDTILDMSELSGVEKEAVDSRITELMKDGETAYFCYIGH